jgi:hypothetical protein
MVKCPECEEEITFLKRTDYGTRSVSYYMNVSLNDDRKTLDVECYDCDEGDGDTDEVGTYHCPECDTQLGCDYQEALEFLKGVKEKKVVISNNTKVSVNLQCYTGIKGVKVDE